LEEIKMPNPGEVGIVTIGDLGLLNKAYAYGLRNLELIDQTVIKASQLLQFFKGPAYDLDEEYLEFFSRESNPGIVNVPINATIDPSHASYNHARGRIYWDMYWWGLDDTVREGMVPQVMDMEAQDSVQFYANVIDYKIIKELLAGTGNVNAASGYWNNAATVEADITTALVELAYQTGQPITQAGDILVLFPTTVLTSIAGLDFIHNVNQSLKKYMSDSYPNMRFIDFTPALNSAGERKIDMMAGTSSDILATNAIICYTGPRVLKVGEFIPKTVSRVETQSLGVFKGALTATRRCFGALTVGRFGAATNPAIIKITGVTT
jgi:hypothetical protein